MTATIDRTDLLAATIDRTDLLAAIDLEVLWCELAGPRRHGGWPCPNPDHPQTGATPPVSIDAQRGLWRCHGCEAGGSAVDAVMYANRCNVADAFAWLRRRTGQDAPPRHPRAPVPRRQQEPAPLPSETAEAALCRFLDARGWRRDVADDAGLHAVRDGRGRARVRFPYRCAGVVAWHQDRATDDFSPRWLAPAGRSPIPFAFGDLGQALDVADACGAVVLCEGAADVVALGHAWPAGAVIGLPGTSSTPLDRLAASVARLDVLTVFDADEAGDRLRSAITPALHRAGCRVAHLRPPTPDLDDWRRACGCDDDRWADELDRALELIEWAEVGR